MSQRNRLAEGGRIERKKPLSFRFNGTSYQGYQGDTLASALLANGIRLVARSFKYHRPRGILSAGSEEPNALVQLEEGAVTEPNARATQIALYDGLTAASQNCWPSVRFDIAAVNNLLARLIPAGFYYKTFMWPASLWMTYERFIRKSAGLGQAPTAKDPARYEAAFDHCDILVVGAGPAGLAVALAAGRCGARVILADEQAEFGGSLLGPTAEIDGKPAVEWIRDSVGELQGMAEVTLQPRTTIAGYFDYNFLTALERVSDHLGPIAGGAKPRQRFRRIRAKRVVLATGAIERPLVFADNDRPGVMLAGAVRTYIARYGVLPGREMVVFTNNDSAYLTALAARAAGAEVAIVDLRANPKGPLVDQARSKSITIHDHAAVTATAGARGITRVEIRKLGADGKNVAGGHAVLDCDCLAMSGGWNPTVHLFSQARGKLRFDAELAAFVPAAGVAINPCFVSGAADGIFDLAQCLANGYEDGLRAADALGLALPAAPAPKADAASTQHPLLAVWQVPSEKPVGMSAQKHFLDFQNDVTAADIHLAARENYRSVEHLKRYTTAGMGTDQGKTSNLNALAIMAEIQDVTVPEIGFTTYRPPYTPVTFGAVAGMDLGDFFDPIRPTAMHPWQVRHGAVFEDVGNWKRPYYYPRPGEDMDQAVQRECTAVRTSAGMLDASTLGKIDLQGPDVAEFLNRIYTNAWSKLGIGRCRYGLMLNEHGMVFDDGVTVRLAENHYHMTTTTGGAARVLNWLEEWLQTEWPELQVFCTSVTEQWAVIAVSGPKARELLAPLTDIDLSAQAFPFLSTQSGRVAGVPARLFRISFTGELSFEINLPAAYGEYVWQAVYDAGKAYDICPYGTEAMHVLRAEKGFIIVGQDTDGTVTPIDLGMEWLVSQKKDFLGRRSLSRSDTAREGRKQLVGLLSEDPAYVLPEGAHLVEEVKSAPPMKTIGHVTSSYMSPNVGRSIALALVEGGLSRMGESLVVRTHDGRTENVTVTGTVFFDKEGERARG